MLRALWTAASGMTAQQMNIDVIANNLANVNTAGFKRSRTDFQDVLYQTDRVPGTAVSEGAQVPAGIQVGLGVRPGAVYKSFSQGTFQQTGNPLDVLIEGDGFLQVTMPDNSTAYTRDGSLKRDDQGRLVTSDGFPIGPTEIVLPEDARSVSIGQDGTVSVTLPNQDEPSTVGTIQLVRFQNPAGLEAVGQNLFKATAASGEATSGTAGQGGFGRIIQGAVEMSNVKVVEEMVNMIVAMRAYEVNSKAIQTSDEMLSIANNVRR
jgi:flagellar basal-body rod protein FlgG